MTDAPKKRPLFQLHLSTCAVLMFVAGGVLWFSTRPAIVTRVTKKCVTVTSDRWPLGFHETHYVGYTPSEALADFERKLPPIDFQNLQLMLPVLLAAAIIFEWHIRRRNRRRND